MRCEPEYGEWEIVEKPTLNSTGLRKKSCGGKHTITEAMPRLFAVNTADTYSIVIVVSIGIGFAKRNPCPISQLIDLSISSCSGVSIPSLTTLISRV